MMSINKHTGYPRFVYNFSKNLLKYHFICKSILKSSIKVLVEVFCNLLVYNVSKINFICQLSLWLHPSFYPCPVRSEVGGRTKRSYVYELYIQVLVKEPNYCTRGAVRH